MNASSSALPEEGLRRLMSESAPSFGRFVDVLCRVDALQRKAVERFLVTRDEIYWRRADEAAKCLAGLLEEASVSVEDAVQAYVRMCHEMLAEQIKFARTGCYSSRSSREAREGLYRSETQMGAYMYALALSLFLWPNHYAIYDFFVRVTNELAGIRRYLEVGPGHGLYLVQSLRRFPQMDVTAVDISPVSAAISERLAKRLFPDARCRFEIADIIGFDDGEYDYVVMCEVLEHLDDPRVALRKIRGFLSPGGRCFLTTCANCPAIDHVYLFRDADDIRRHLSVSGLSVIEDLALPVRNIPMRLSGAARVGVNYAALLERGGQ